MSATFGTQFVPPSPPSPESTSCGAGSKSDPQVWTYIIGVVLGVLASIGINVGNNVQALGLAKQAAEGAPRHNRQFWMGTITFVVASIINFAAFGLAPAAVLAPLESVQFVSNLCFARFVNHVNITWHMIFGSFLVVFGTVLAIAFGPSRVLQFSVDDLIDFWAGADWIIYLIINLTLAFGTQTCHMVYERAHKAGKDLKHSATVLPVTFGVSSALAGSYCVVQAKCMSELFEIFLAEPTCILTHWFFYVTLVLLLICLFIWLSRLNAALTKYDPLFIIPLLQSNYILFSTLTGGVFFREFSQLSTAGWIFFVVGILIMFFGLFMLAPSTDAPEANPKVYPETAIASPEEHNSSLHEGQPDSNRDGADLPPLARIKLPPDPDEGSEAESTKQHRGSASVSTTLDEKQPQPRAVNLREVQGANSPEFASRPQSRRSSASSVPFQEPRLSSFKQPPLIFEPSTLRAPQAVGAVGAVVMLRSATPVVQEYASRRFGGFRRSRELPGSQPTSTLASTEPSINLFTASDGGVLPAPPDECDPVDLRSTWPPPNAKKKKGVGLVTEERFDLAVRKPISTGENVAAQRPLTTSLEESEHGSLGSNCGERIGKDGHPASPVGSLREQQVT
mmetsp:Transcript_27016/g.65158  ORF Transcript_27016/g.65158 Transcript_27016/m.65158 type:complete len:622 (+) Transcript_27016:263-2128(+)